MARSRQAITVLGIAVAVSLTGAPQIPVHAQVSERAAPVCMVRSVGTGSELSIILPATDVEGMKAKGFEPQPCTMKFGSADEREAWRDSICEIASAWREDLQHHFERERGERPAVLCGMAEMSVGQWERKSGR